MSEPLKVVHARFVDVEAVQWDAGGDAALLSLEMRASERVFDFALAPADAWAAVFGLARALERIGHPGAAAVLAAHRGG